MIAGPADYDALLRAAAATELNVYPYLPFVPERGQGSYLYDTAGRRYLDYYCGHAVALTGHCHPHVVRAITDQAQRLIFYSNATLSPVRAAATELLLRQAPTPDMRVFYCCSGSEANENSLKTARRMTGRRKVLSFEQGFHGRTLGALTATGLPKYRETAGPVLVPDHHYLPLDDAAAFDAAIDSDTAAVIVEPIQSLAGVFAAAPEFYRHVAAGAAAAGAVLIFDELQTGLGRCGAMFHAGDLGIRPDIITLAKGLASGVPCGAMLVAPHLAERARHGDHGSTFGGAPLAMAAVRATLEVIERERLAENALRQGDRLMTALRALPGVRQVRGRGLLIGVQLGRPAKDGQARLLQHGVIVGTSSDPHTLRLLPPLTLGDAEVAEFLGAATAALA